MKQNTSRLLSILLVLCMTLALLPGTAWAAASDKCGKNLTWSYNNGTLTISGTGAMDNYEYDIVMGSTNAPWNAPGNTITSVVIKKGVTTIGQDAFYGYSNLTSVTIPDSVTTIGSGAFYRCYGLTSITIPNSVTSIERSAFYQCSGLTSVTIPRSVINIGWDAFAWCSNLSTINVANGNSAYCAVDGVLFNANRTLLHTYPAGKSAQSYRIPNSVTAIGSFAFYGSSRLTSVSIPSSVTTIGDVVFMYGNLEDIYYGGTAAQWKKITMGEYNDDLLSARIHYNSTSAGAVAVTVNGAAIEWTDAAPFVANGRTMVPLRAVGDALGLTVNWDNNTREAIFSNGAKTIYFPIGKTTARTGDGQSIQMDTTAVLKDGRTYAPVRYLAEYFGFTVDWDNNTQTVLITGEALNYFSDDDLIRMAKAYYRKYHGTTPPIVTVWPTDKENIVQLQLYEIVKDAASSHTATWEWYTVSRVTGKGTNVLSDDVDLTEVL